MTYKTEYTFEQRKKDTDSIRRKYPYQIPVLCEKDYNDYRSPEILRRKYLVSPDLTVGQFIFIIRKKIKITEETALYICVNNTIPSTSERIGSLFHKYADSDGHLYIVYMLENTFGRI